MKKFFIFTLTFVTISTVNLFSQNNGSIIGNVFDAISNTPLKGVSISMKLSNDSNSNLIGAISNENGFFKISNVVLGKAYKIEVKMIGYETDLKNNIIIKNESNELNLGSIKLIQTTIKGQEVVVVDKKEMVVIKADKKVFTVEDNPQFSATNVSELLAQIPSVSVDQDGNVTMRGSSVTIMMNDRPILMPQEQLSKFLQSLPSNEVQEIELKTNPSAKYDARMQGGIINIVSKKKLSDMFGGNISIGTDSRLGLNTNAGLFYNGKIINASLNGGIFYGPQSNSSTSLRINYLDSIERTIKTNATGTSTSSNKSGSGQVDYNFTDNDVASVSFNINRWPSNRYSGGITEYYNISNKLIRNSIDTSYRDPNSTEDGGYDEGSFLLKHNFSKDHLISLEWNYTGWGWSNSSIYKSTNYVGSTIDSLKSIDRIDYRKNGTKSNVLSLSYENPVNDKLKLELGGKYEANNGDNITELKVMDYKKGEYVQDSIQSNHYIPQNSIYAGYINVSLSVSNELSFQSGIRSEFANVSAKYSNGLEIISKNFNNLFPSGSVNFNFNQSNSLSLSYRRSVSLPSVDDLNPTKVKWSNIFIKSGNPDLEPEFENSFELGYNTFWGIGNNVSTSLFLTKTSGNIENSQQIIDELTYSTDANFNGTDKYGIESNIMLRPVTWLNLRLGGSVFNTENRGSNIPGDIYSHDLGYTLNGYINSDIYNGLSFGSNIYYRSGSIIGGNNNSGYSWMSLSLNQKLFDKKLSISLRVNDPFNFQKWEMKYQSYQFYSENLNKWTSRTIGININYRFGTTPKMEEFKKEKSNSKGGSTNNEGVGIK